MPEVHATFAMAGPLMQRTEEGDRLALLMLQEAENAKAEGVTDPAEIRRRMIEVANREAG